MTTENKTLEGVKPANSNTKFTVTQNIFNEIEKADESTILSPSLLRKCYQIVNPFTREKAEKTIQHRAEELGKAYDDIKETMDRIASDVAELKASDFEAPEGLGLTEDEQEVRRVWQMLRKAPPERYRNGEEKPPKIIQSVKNFEIVLAEDARFKNKIRFDDFSRRTYVIDSLPWDSNESERPWENADDSMLHSLIEDDYGLRSKNDMIEAVANIARRNRYNRVTDRIRELNDQYAVATDCIKQLLPLYVGAEETPYNTAVMRHWMVGAIRRAFDPGCKFDEVLVLKGPQGCRKSSFLQALALGDEFYFDMSESLDTKDALQDLLGAWIVEFAELSSFSKTKSGFDSVKGFVSRRQDTFRPSFERRRDTYKRSCAFAATTNNQNFLIDQTGNRRFLVVNCGINEPVFSVFKSDETTLIKRAWVEAYRIYLDEILHSNLPHLLPTEIAKEAEQMQQESATDDGLRGLIIHFLYGDFSEGESLESKQPIKEKACPLQIWQEALGKDDRPAKKDSAEINNILAQLPNWQAGKTPMRFGVLGQQRGFKYVPSTNVDAKDGFIDAGDNAPF